MALVIRAGDIDLIALAQQQNAVGTQMRLFLQDGSELAGESRLGLKRRLTQDEDGMSAGERRLRLLGRTDDWRLGAAH